jgi:hypothetical protein
MIKQTTLAIIFGLAMNLLPASAQSYDFSDSQGNQNNTDNLMTGQGPNSMPVNLGPHAIPSPVYKQPHQVLNPINSVVGGGAYQQTLAPKFGMTGISGLLNTPGFGPIVGQTGIGNLLGGLDNLIGGTGSYNGLPGTNMDSFVYQSMLNGTADSIYGDEGSDSIPPINTGFIYADRINNGIWGSNAAGLTTGHGSYLPSAWGYDEFIAPPGEWYQSGANSTNGQINPEATPTFGELMPQLP